MSRRHVMEFWEELPKRKNNIQHFDVQPGKPIFVVHPPEDVMNDLARQQAAIDGFRELANELKESYPDSTAVFMPPNWCFRIIRFEDENDDESSN